MTTQRSLKSKICLVGEKSVGKTSLIRRYVLNMFDEQYLTTIGTRVSKKEVRVLLPEQDLLVDIDMTIWDIMGEKGFRELLKDVYFYGANGILAVADFTRRRTLDDLDDWVDGIEHVVGKVPILLAVNKADLREGAQFAERDVAQIAKAYGSEYMLTSARTGEKVEDAFLRLGSLVAEHQLQLV
ncbi:MAG TPA: Rab family GTPase [Thermoplasmata archaeon]|nr:Rab family GTPase [Thermoplasmata archaeon]